jgi:hypothetical protein
MASSVTALARLGIGTTSTVDSALDYREFGPGIRRELRDMNGTRGSFNKFGNRVRVNRNVITPRLVAEPTVTEWTKYFPWIMDGTPTGTTTLTYPMANTTAERFVHQAPAAGESYLLTGVAVDNATLRASSGEPLSLELDLLGRTYSDSPAAFPAITLDTVTQPFILSDLILTVASVARECRDFSFMVRKNLDRNRYLNSLNLTRTQKLARQISCAISIPSGDNAATWNLGEAGATLTAVFTNPNSAAVLSISCIDWRFTPSSPDHPFNQEGFLALDGECYQSGSTEPVIITLTP